jgi:hypothetical protein
MAGNVGDLLLGQSTERKLKGDSVSNLIPADVEPAFAYAAAAVRNEVPLTAEATV